MISKKKSKKKKKKWENQQIGFGVETGRGRGHGRGQPARAHADAVAPISSTAATLKLFFSRPPLSGAPRHAVFVDAARTFSYRCSALVKTLKPCHLCSIHFWCSSRRVRTFLFPFCVHKVPGYCAVVSGLISIEWVILRMLRIGF